MSLPVGIRKSNDDLKTLVYDVKEKKNRYITPAEARGLTIAFPDQFKKGKFIGKKVRALVGGDNSLVSAGKVDVVLASPKQAFSIATNTIPFLNSSAGARAQMAVKMSEQALPLSEREAPLVQVKVGKMTMEQAIGTGFSVKAIESGTVKSVTANRVVITTKDGEVEQPLFNNMALNNKAFLHAETLVKAGDKVEAGQVIADSNFTKDGELAIGTNLKAAYIPWKGYNFEDGIVITESAALKLASEHMNQFAVKPDKATELSTDQFVAWKPNALTVEQQNTLNANGVVKKGTILRKGDPLWVGVRENKNDPDYIAMRKLGANFKAKRGYMEAWEKDVDGVVVDVVKSGKAVKVYVKSREPAVIGDKLANRHGAKGIITKVIPDGEAPHTADGEPVQILLNPHGVVGRINPGQILETAAAKIAEKDGKPYVVDNFSGIDNARDLIAALKKAKIEDTELLYDPHSKEPLGKVLVGPQFTLKLSKQATSQFSARAEGKYDLNRSPLRGGIEGGKAVDLITFYSMLAHGSRANLREMATFKGTKNQPFWDWLAVGSGRGLLKPPPEPTFAYHKFEAYLKGAGVNVARRGSKMVLGPMTDKEIDKLSNGEVKEPVFFRGKNLKEEKKGLFDPVVTGGRQGENWSHMQLAEAIPNPIFEEPIKTLTGLKKEQFLGIVRGEVFVDKKTGELAEEGQTGGEAIRTLLKKVDVDKEIEVWTEKAKTAKGAKPLDAAHKRLKYLHALKKLKLRPEDAYIQTKIAIVPPQFRQISELDDGTLANPGLNTLYRDVGLVNNELKWQNKQEQTDNVDIHRYLSSSRSTTKHNDQFTPCSVGE